MYNNDSFLKVFGQVSVVFATLDAIVTLTILRLIDKNQRVKTIAMNDRTTLQQKFRLIEKLNPRQVIDSAVLAELHSFIPQALAIGEKRNRFIHDLWIFKPEDVENGKLTRLRIKDLDNWIFKPEREEEPTMADLQDFLSQLSNLLNRYEGVLRRLPV